jgi:hypothetical protein
MRFVSRLAFVLFFGSACAAHAQDRVTIQQWSNSPPQGVNILPIPCPCLRDYVTAANKFILNNLCTSPVAALAIRRPFTGAPPDALLAPAPNKEFAPFSLGVSEYLSVDRDLTKEIGFLHVSCPATPNFLPPTTSRCVAQRFAQPPVLCRKDDPSANAGDQCSCTYSGQAFDGRVQEVPPSPLD